MSRQFACLSFDRQPQGHGSNLAILWLTRVAVSTMFLSSVLRAQAHDAPGGSHAELELSAGDNCMSYWCGRPHLDPREEAALDGDTLKAKQEDWNHDRDSHWKVVPDEAKGEHVFVSDGQGVFLTTRQSFADFDLQLQYRLMVKHTDSGIYLRGSPQVQIWDPNDPDAIKNGADKGSGALWNNAEGHAGKWPLVRADSAIGEWNTIRIRMVGARVWVWLNAQLTVDGAVLENYWDAAEPMFRTGPIQLQTHGGEIQFRRIKIVELTADESNAILAQQSGTGFAALFNGTNLEGWKGPRDSARVTDGALVAQSGTLYTAQEFGDFQLRFEFLLPPGGNNGLAIRYPGEGDGAYDGMCELQVLDDGDAKYASIDPRQSHGSAYGMVAAKRGFLRKPGEWNFELVTVKGSTIQVELNGTPILNCDLSEVKEFMSETPHPGLKRSRGHIGLCGHGDPVQFKNLDAKEL